MKRQELMKSRAFLSFPLVSLLLFGCASSPPALRMETAESLNSYGIFEVATVTNDTGKTFDFDIAEELGKQIKSRLETRGYVVAAGSGGTEKVLIIKSSITAYEPGSAFKRWLAPGAGKTQATVMTSLVDKRTGEVVGEMLSADAVGSGGLYSIGADRWLLESIAKSIVENIEERMKKVPGIRDGNR